MIIVQRQKSWYSHRPNKNQHSSGRAPSGYLSTVIVDYDDHPANDNMSVSSFELDSTILVTSGIPEPALVILSDAILCSANIIFSPSEREATKPLLINDASANGNKFRLFIDCGATHNVFKPNAHEGKRKPVIVHMTRFNGGVNYGPHK